MNPSDREHTESRKAFVAPKLERYEQLPRVTGFEFGSDIDDGGNGDDENDLRPR